MMEADSSDVNSCQGMLPPLEGKELRTHSLLEALEETSHADTMILAPKDTFWTLAL